MWAVFILLNSTERIRDTTDGVRLPGWGQNKRKGSDRAGGWRKCVRGEAMLTVDPSEGHLFFFCIYTSSVRSLLWDNKHTQMSRHTDTHAHTHLCLKKELLNDHMGLLCPTQYVSGAVLCNPCSSSSITYPCLDAITSLLHLCLRLW